MTSDSLSTELHSTTATALAPALLGPSTDNSAILARLAEWFGAEFQLADGVSGDLLHPVFGQSANNWNVRGPLCCAVARNGRAEIIADEDPLLVLAIPIHAQSATVVAVATFATSPTVSPARLLAVADALGLEPADAAHWLAGQTGWSAQSLLAMGQLASERLSLDDRVRVLEKEATDLSANLSKTYEEISLLYRLTHNLKLTSKDEQLGAKALKWLAEVVPAESLAIQFLPRERGSIRPHASTEPQLLTHGPCPLDCDQVSRLVEHFDLHKTQRPLIVNRHLTAAHDWPWPEAREVIVVALADGNKTYGWLLALNHKQGEEFGTVEASLLSSVAAILGIHGGNAELYQKQREFFASVVRALTSAIDAKDPYTCGHSDRVARVAVRLAEELGCDRKQVDTVYLSGLLHDVGKIGIDDNVLRKPGKLTDAEYEHIKTHTEIGHRILQGIKQLDDVLPVVLHHHEQWDGKGYPHGLAGTEIPLLARIVAVADAFDAMSSDRPYRKGLGNQRLLEILRQGAGTQWDASVVDAFLRTHEDIRALARREVEELPIDLCDWS